MNNSEIVLFEIEDSSILLSVRMTGDTVYILRYEECRAVTDRMRFGDESELFGREKDDSFKGSIGNIYQSFDGNKRIAETIFLYFLDCNGILYDDEGNKLLDDYTLAALTIMIAESQPEEKEKRRNKELL
ncbi:MAG: hypothetical protein Q4D81_14305 [Eubacteriales bacterium]|nr:hypothetical protein [Eubacteriales bacterium]